MRSIGQKNKKKLLGIIKEEIDIQKDDKFTHLYGLDHNSAEMRIEQEIPSEWYEIWEGAKTEIENLIDSALTNYTHRKVIEF
jgi:hypothetical protein